MTVRQSNIQVVRDAMGINQKRIIDAMWEAEKAIVNVACVLEKYDEITEDDDKLYKLAFGAILKMKERWT